jgi:Peptidase C80 family
MYMAKADATVSHFKIIPDTKKPLLKIGPKYDGQIVLALIDGPTVTYGGAPITGGNVHTFLNDATVTSTDKQEYKRQEGERQSAENLHEKHEGAPNHHLCIIEDYEPNTEAQKEKIRAGLATMAKVGGRIRLYVVAHHDPESRRMAGLDASALASLVANSPHATGIKSITLVGCHTAGEAGQAEDVAQLASVETFASEFHRRLGEAHQIYTFVNGYTTFVQINVRGQKLARFSEQNAPARKLELSKVRFYWDEYKRPARAVVTAE